MFLIVKKRINLKVLKQADKIKGSLINFLITLRALFTKFLTLRLNRKLCNMLNDWLVQLIPTNHRVGYIIREITWKFKSW